MKVLFLDTETTGLLLHPAVPLERQPQVIEFGGLLIDTKTGKESTLELLIQPGIPLPEEIVKITGITDEMLAGKPLFREVAAEVAAFISSADVAVAHNLPFDSAMINNEFDRAGQGCFWPKVCLCTVQENQAAAGKRPRLKDWHEQATGEPYPQTHRAIDDVRAMARAFVASGMLDTLKQFEPQMETLQ